MHDTKEIDDLNDRLNAIIRLAISDCIEVAQLLRDSDDNPVHDGTTGDGSPEHQPNHPL